MKRYLTAYGIWLVAVAALAFGLASWYRRVEEISWSETARRILTGNVDATDATDATGKTDGAGGSVD